MIYILLIIIAIGVLLISREGKIILSFIFKIGTKLGKWLGLFMISALIIMLIVLWIKSWDHSAKIAVPVGVSLAIVVGLILTKLARFNLLKEIKVTTKQKIIFATILPFVIVGLLLLMVWFS